MTPEILEYNITNVAPAFFGLLDLHKPGYTLPVQDFGAYITEFMVRYRIHDLPVNSVVRFDIILQVLDRCNSLTSGIEETGDEAIKLLEIHKTLIRLLKALHLGNIVYRTRSNQELLVDHFLSKKSFIKAPDTVCPTSLEGCLINEFNNNVCQISNYCKENRLLGCRDFPYIQAIPHNAYFGTVRDFLII